MLVWLKSSLTPQEIRDRILDSNSDFQRRMVEYLESVHQGEFITGTMESVGNRLDKLKDEDPLHTCPTESLPTPPPPKCTEVHASSEETRPEATGGTF